MIHDLDSIGFELHGACNLACKACYVKKINRMIDSNDVIEFANRYIEFMQNYNLKFFWISRGEVTMHPRFAEMINALNSTYPGISHLVQTNGMIIEKIISRLDRIDNLEISFSIDGFKKDHDWNRGANTFERVMANLVKANCMGIQTHVVSIIMPRNYKQINEFKQFIERTAPGTEVTFFHVQSNEAIAHMNPDLTKRSGFSSSNNDYIEMMEWLRDNGFENTTYYLPNDTHFYISVDCDGNIFNCCENQFQIGTIHDDVKAIVKKLRASSCQDCRAWKNCFEL